MRGPEKVHTGGREGGEGGVAESHAQTLHPKEEQHGGPGGHLFSQVCSPNVIKIGAARSRHPPPRHAVGAGARV